MERLRLGSNLPGHRYRAERAERRYNDLRGDDQDIAGMVEEGRRYRAPTDVRRGGHHVHVEHLCDKGEVRPIVRYIAEGDERHIERDGGGAANLGEADGKHAKPRAWTDAAH